MKLTKKIRKAINFACLLHGAQVRKDNKRTPYVSHCFAVYVILSTYTNDEDILVAGLLHDVLEDVKGYRYNDLVRDFGKRVAKIVKEISEDKDPNVAIDKKATWLGRKEKYLATLQEDSMEALIVCAADKIHNLQASIDEYNDTGRGPWENFNAPLGQQVWYYRKVLEILKKRLPEHPIVKETEKVFLAFLGASGQVMRYHRKS